LSIFSISCQPKSWCLGIEIISNAQIILPDLNYLRYFTTLRLFCWILLFFSWLLSLSRLCEDVLFVTIINIKYFFFSWWLLLGTRRNDLHGLSICIIINIYNISSSILSFSLRISGFNPSIPSVSF